MRFVVTVIGDDPDEQLAPYRVFEATGIVDKYVQSFDITKNILGSITSGMTMTEALGYYNIDHSVSDESIIDVYGQHKFGYVIMRSGKLVKAVWRTIPDKKWDEYWLGCEWPGFFSLKPHCRGTLGEESIDELVKKGDKNMDNIADQAYKKDIDIEETGNRFGKEAQKEYKMVAALFGGTIPLQL